ncbi:MAG: PilZ domain-containing protein [Elusimicrobia bacterium]|nr:PilZ domain-containing protein [Elusimicrobiota bacterium]
MTTAPEGKWHLPRADPRAVTDFVVEVYHSDGKTLRGISRLLDLSVSGACVESTSDWNEGEKVVIHVLLDQGNLLTLPAQLMWKRMFSKTYQYGLNFGQYAETTRGVIGDFVRNFETRLHRMSPKTIYKV